MTKTLARPIGIYESAEVREYALLQSLLPTPKPNKVSEAIDLVARMAMFYVAFSLFTDLGIYVWRLLTCPC